MYRLDPDGGAVIGEMPIRARTGVGQGYGRVVVDSEVWVLNSDDRTISRLAEASNAVTATIGFDGGEESGDLAHVAGDLWLSDPSHNRVIRVDGETNETVAEIPARRLPQGVVGADGAVWVANHHGRPTGSVWRIDPRKNRVVARIRVGETPELGPAWMAAGAGSVWVGVPGIEAVVRIDPKRNAVEAIVPVPDGGVCGQIVADDAGVWVASGFCGDGNLTRIDPSTNQVAAQISSPLWSTVFGAAIGFGSVWINTDGGPFEVDPATDEVVSRLALAGDPVWGGDLAVGAGSLWIHDGEHSP